MWECFNNRLTRSHRQKVLQYFGFCCKGSSIDAKDIVQCLQIPDIGRRVSKCLQEVCCQCIGKYYIIFCNWYVNLSTEYQPSNLLLYTTVQVTSLVKVECFVSFPDSGAYIILMSPTTLKHEQNHYKGKECFPSRAWGGV